MAKICACADGNNNTGISSCPTLMDVTKGLIVVERVANDGTDNAIPAGTVLDAAFFEGKLNETDPSKRYYPVMNLEDVINSRADSVFQTTSGGSNKFLREGPRTFEAGIIGASPKVKGFLDSWSCNKLMVFVVDFSRNMWGIENATKTALEGMPIDGNTNDPKFLFASDAVKNTAMIGFEFDELMRDENIGYFASGDITGVDILKLNGLLDVNTLVSAITTTTFTLNLTENFGPISAKNPIEGFIITDFTYVEVLPTPGPIVITSVTADPLIPGNYDFVVPSAASTESFLLTASKTGFDFPPTTVLIP